ncbi:polysaccharide biosynthesis tyrosine autokinase [Microlunatus panaciterrae]|uniref:non-specific protein-tyrosine kinase n=1 Tax=Microlunatus panaciterrae TaxID=400768 RepID=A0ABS2RHP7_9ACTN|nr:polysaccharide biosynthesis tyrosine autokinase [Microlunatus panaciterrae]MBM7798535.1 capsular exopolysaccharide synthesis family protein [Microlunatus panaciterrae]
MELRDYLTILRRRWITVVVVTLATVAAAAALTLTMTPQYTATTRLFFGVQGGESVTDMAQGSTYTEKQMSSYAEVATSPLVLDRVIKDLNLDTTSGGLAGHVSATAPTGTVILEISATETDPKLAARIANSVSEQLTAVAGDLSPERPDGSEAVRATILAKAQVPGAPSAPSVKRNLALGLLLGLLLGMGVALLRHLLDTKVRSEQDVQALTDSAVLGIVPFDISTPNHPVAMHDDPLGARSEAMRRLRTNLQFVDVAEHAKSIVVTSSIPGEGKSTTTINLAVSLADAGQRVLLVDADLRRPSVAEYLGLEGRAGLTTVLIGRADLDDVVQPWQQSSLDILPAGQIPPNPSELLGSKAMQHLMEQLSQRYDMVLLDSPPLLPVTDAAILSKFAGGTLVVVGADRIHRPQLREALESLTTVDANVVGIVLNKIARRDTSAYVYDSSYAPEDEVTFHPAAAPPQRAQAAEPDALTAAWERQDQHI